MASRATAAMSAAMKRAMSVAMTTPSTAVTRSNAVGAPSTVCTVCTATMTRGSTGGGAYGWSGAGVGTRVASAAMASSRGGMLHAGWRSVPACEDQTSHRDKRAYPMPTMRLISSVSGSSGAGQGAGRAPRRPDAESARDMLRSLAPTVPRRSLRQLWGGKIIMSGNKVSESGNKSRRRWLPNVQNKRLESSVLGHKVRVKLTTHALRCIKKAGGLDEYLLNTSDRKLASLRALELKQQIIDRMQKQ